MITLSRGLLAELLFFVAQPVVVIVTAIALSIGLDDSSFMGFLVIPLISTIALGINWFINR